MDLFSVRGPRSKLVLYTIRFRSKVSKLKPKSIEIISEKETSKITKPLKSKARKKLHFD